MQNITDILPAPVHHYSQEKTIASKPKSKKVYNVPSYGERASYIPRKLEDFGDGGAFPEIHITQYPLNMGKSGNSGDSRVVSVAVDENGEADYQKNLLSQGNDSRLVLHSKISSLVGYSGDADLSRPSEEEVAALTLKTKEAMEKKIGHKIANSLPGKLPEGSLPKDLKPSQFYKYTPVESLTGKTLQERVIRIVEVPVDPLEPANARHKKVPNGFNDAPVPIMHSPPRKLTIQDQQDWKIPPCVSNWKNARGHTIPLDKRLLADGRDLKQAVINDRFAMLTETLQLAERNVREEVELRNSIIRKQKEKEKVTQDELMRQRAAEIRQEREEDEQMEKQEESKEERQARIERNKQRELMRRQQERDYRLKQAGRRTQEEREKERDISERMALGQAAVSATTGVTYDSRLFDQSGGLTSGFANDEDYNQYSKPLFTDKGNSIYRPREENTMKYVADDVIENLAKLDNFSSTSELEKAADQADAQYRMNASKRSGPLEFTDGVDNSKKRKHDKDSD